MEIRAWKRGHSGWELLSLAEALTPDAIIGAIKATDGIIRVDVGNVSHYRTTSDRSRWVALIRGKGEVRELNEGRFRDTLAGWNENEGEKIGMFDRVFGDLLNIKGVKLTQGDSDEG